MIKLKLEHIFILNKIDLKFLNILNQYNTIMKTEEFNDTTIVIGQNAKENWDIINFDCDHIWLHLNSYPSCHVIIKDNNPDEDVLAYAATLCKDNTKYRNLKNLKICYTKCNNLKKGNETGSVIYKSKRKVNTITI